MKMKTILASAYSINPYKGSEDAMGWNYVYQVARFNKVIAVTRENNREHIERYMNAHPDPVYDNMCFLYFDLPFWMRFWKKKSQGVILYYLLWQRALPGFILKHQLEFDITHNLNFHNDWAPSFLWKLGKPFVWGPIGHHPQIPEQYLEPYGTRVYLRDRITGLVKKFFWCFSLSLRTTLRKADYIWCMNSSVGDVLNLKKKRHHISPSVASQDFGWIEDKQTGKFTIISAGRLVPLKGFDLTVKSFSRFISALNVSEREHCELVIVGSGPEEIRLKQMVHEEGLEQYVQFISWIDRNDLMLLFKNASAFLFPSHEGAGMVVPEALSFGLPVICLANSGPGEMVDETCGFTVPIQDYQSTVNGLAGSISAFYRVPGLLQSMSRNAREKFMKAFHWDVRGEQLKNTYNSL